jgi:hypothetical protein
MIAPRRALVANPETAFMGPAAPVFLNIIVSLVGGFVFFMLTYRFLTALGGTLVYMATVHVLLVRFNQKEPNFGGQLYAWLLRYAPTSIGYRRWARLGAEREWIELDP